MARATTKGPLGQLIYDTSTTFEFDERVLVHLQVVILAKLRRMEGFEFSWTTDAAAGSGRNAIWLAPGIPVEFRYRSGKPAPVNMAWVRALMAAAQSTGGLCMVPEPATP